MASSGATEVAALLSIINNAAQAALSQYAALGADVPSIYSIQTHPLDSAEDTLALRAAIKTLEGACYQLCATLAPPSHTLHKAAANNIHDCLSFAIEAKLADVIVEHPSGIHAHHVAEFIGAEEEKIDHILRRLSIENYFYEISPRVYAPSRLTYPLLSSNATSATAFLFSTTLKNITFPALYTTITSPKLAKSFKPNDAALIQALNSGALSEEDKYNDFYHWAGSNPTRRLLFHRGMIGLEKILGRLNVLHYYPWSHVSTFCDVGSGVGAFSMALAKVYPQIEITLFDLPGTIEQAKSEWVQEHPAALKNDENSTRVSFSAGDFLKGMDVHNQDIYYLRNILHNWSDADCRIILRNIRKAMGNNPNSRILIHDFVIEYGIPVKPDIETPGSHPIGSTGQTLMRAPYPMISNYGAGNAIMFSTGVTMLLSFNGMERPLNKTIENANDAGLEFVKLWDLGETALIELKAADSKFSEM